MRSRIRNPIAVAITSIIWLHYAPPISISLNVADASASPSSCHELPCQNSDDGSHGTRNNLSNNNLPRNLALPIHEEYYINEVEQWINKKQTEIENTVFLSYDSQGYARQSTAYAYDDFLETLHSMSVNGVGGGDDQILFYIGQTDAKGIVHGLVNIAAFLAHAMAVSIKYDVCDEFNMDATDFTQKYAISNSCGQWGHSYQDEVCVGDEAFMTCDVDVDIAITAASSRDGENAPPPLECRPKESAEDFTGHWDAELGFLSETFPYANRVGVMHNEGCCWWGRGVLMTRGTCNFGKLNHYLGRLAAAQGFINFYDVDLCVYPEIVCEGEDTMGLRWSVGYFEWADRVQTYQNTAEGWDYMKDLDTFIESGFVDVNRFIDVVGKALPFCSDEEKCLAAEEKVKQERRDNFLKLVFNVFDLPYLVETTPFPTPPPTNRPTRPIQDSTSPPTSRQTPRPSPRPAMETITLTEQPSSMPAKPPTKPPAVPPTTALPTKFPTARPFVRQTQFPTAKPTVPRQTPSTTSKPTKFPTDRPSVRQTQFPTAKPTVPVPRQTQSPTSEPTIVQTLPNICDGQSSAFIPVEECREYVQCLYGDVFAQNSCGVGLLFDSTLGNCNWEAAVICTAPTSKPTPAPTPKPTPEPTQQTPKPTLQPSFPPTFPPSIRSAAIPGSTRPPFEGQRPIGKPFMSDSVGQKEEGEDLINLPSGASQGMRSNLVLSIGFLWMALVGALMILS